MIQLPEILAGKLEALAKEEDISLDILVTRLVSEHLERRKRSPAERKTVRLPLISKEEVGMVVQPAGHAVDEIFASEDFRP